MICFRRDLSDGGEHGWKGYCGKKYVARLPAEELEKLQPPICKGQILAQRLLKARIR